MSVTIQIDRSENVVCGTLRVRYENQTVRNTIEWPIKKDLLDAAAIPEGKITKLVSAPSPTSKKCVVVGYLKYVEDTDDIKMYLHGIGKFDTSNIPVSEVFRGGVPNRPESLLFIKEEIVEPSEDVPTGPLQIETPISLSVTRIDHRRYQIETYFPSSGNTRVDQYTGDALSFIPHAEKWYVNWNGSETMTPKKDGLWILRTDLTPHRVQFFVGRNLETPITVITDNSLVKSVPINTPIRLCLEPLISNKYEPNPADVINEPTANPVDDTETDDGLIELAEIADLQGTESVCDRLVQIANKYKVDPFESASWSETVKSIIKVRSKVRYFTQTTPIPIRVVSDGQGFAGVVLPPATPSPGDVITFDHTTALDKPSPELLLSTYPNLWKRLSDLPGEYGIAVVFGRPGQGTDVTVELYDRSCPEFKPPVRILHGDVDTSIINLIRVANDLHEQKYKIQPTVVRREDGLLVLVCNGLEVVTIASNETKARFDFLEKGESVLVKIDNGVFPISKARRINDETSDGS